MMVAYAPVWLRCGPSSVVPCRPRARLNTGSCSFSGVCVCCRQLCIVASADFLVTSTSHRFASDR